MIARRLLKDDWWKVTAYTGIMLFNLVATIAAYPTFKANYAMIVKIIPPFLGPIRRAISDAGSGGIDVFLGINHLFKAGNILGAAAAIVFALGTIVREVEVGTIGLLLSRPVSRAKILFSFATVHILEIVIPLVVVTALAPPLTAAILDQEPLKLAPLMLGAVHASIFAVMIYCIALLIAVLFSEQIKVAAVAGGICVVSFMLYFIDATRDYTLYALSSFGFFVKVIQTGTLPWFEPVVCLCIAATTLITAAIIFNRKDY